MTRFERDRGANVLVLALGLSVLIACELYIVNAYSSGNLHQTARSTARLHAVYVGESAFGRILARLRQTSWKGRWFAERPEDQVDVPLCGGHADWYVADARDADRRADVWIRARFDGASVTMYWRIHHREDRLDLRGGIRPEFFTFLPDTSPRPVAGASDAAFRSATDLMIESQRRRPAAVTMARAAATTTDFAGLARVLRLSPPAVVPDALAGLGDGAVRPQGAYLSAIATELPPAMPDPPAEVSTGSALVRAHPVPIDFPAVVSLAFAGHGLPPPDNPDPTRFADPDRARAEWIAATALRPGSTRDPAWIDQWTHVRRLLEQMDKRAETGCGPCNAVLTDLVAYVEEVTRLESERSGRVRPRSADVDPLRFGGNGRSHVLSVYGRWWNE